LTVERTPWFTVTYVRLKADPTYVVSGFSRTCTG